MFGKCWALQVHTKSLAEMKSCSLSWNIREKTIFGRHPDCVSALINAANLILVYVAKPPEVPHPAWVHILSSTRGVYEGGCYFHFWSGFISLLGLEFIVSPAGFFSLFVCLFYYIDFKYILKTAWLISQPKMDCVHLSFAVKYRNSPTVSKWPTRVKTSVGIADNHQRLD